MAFDIYNLIRLAEVKNYLRENKKFTVLEQETIIRSSYYPIEEKLKYLKQLLKETDNVDPHLQERVELYEYIVNFIHYPREDAIYMVVLGISGYDVDFKDNNYELSEQLMGDTHYFKSYERLMEYCSEDNIKWRAGDKICVDIVLSAELGRRYEKGELVQPIWFNLSLMDGKMRIYHFEIDDKWFLKQGWSKECLYHYNTWDTSFRSTLPFETGNRVRLQTPAMKKALMGIVESSKDFYGSWYNFLWCEDENYGAEDIRKLIENRSYGEIQKQKIKMLDISFPQLDVLGEYLTYDWIERAEGD
ncbi:MAG: hypothetical protein GX567_18090 [Clostridia bacterium]|nr:hypothetical protein [Clostridia bacterium]